MRIRLRAACQRPSVQKGRRSIKRRRGAGVVVERGERGLRSNGRTEMSETDAELGTRFKYLSVFQRGSPFSGGG